MKRLLLISVLFIITFNIRATHYMGGEITWECIPAGQTDAGKFIFTLKAYRECYTNNGGSAANYDSTITIMSNSPADSFTLIRLPGYPMDISPVCNSNSSFTHITCVGLSIGAANMGAVQLHIYKSSPIQLNAVPPSTGWTFSWASCCRNPATNVSGQSGQPGWYLRAIMYPYNNQNTYPCFDNSPEFAENPKTVISAGYPFSYSNLAIDYELDSLSFEWGQPLDNSINPLPYMSGYSYQNPLPSTSQNANNVNASMNPITGEVSLTSYTTGAFVTSIKVSSYRCGILISEIWRDIQVVITAATTNLPPSLTPPFLSGTSYDISVYAGQNISFPINAQDFQFLPNGSPQTMSLDYFGSQFGSYVPASPPQQATLSSTIGCFMPPCATITPAPGPNAPLTGIFGIQTQFNWQTTCDHLNQTIGCNSIDNTFLFLFSIKDDYCPIPASDGKIIRITILPPVLQAPIADSISFNYNTYTANITWNPVIDSTNIFEAYYIYYSTSLQGPYNLIDSVLSISQTSYSYNTGNTQNSYFYIKTKSRACNISNLSVQSNILSLNLLSIEKQLSEKGFMLYQNQPNPANGITNIPYYINKEIGGRFILYDISGRIVLQKDLFANQGRNNFDIETSILPEGIYYYRLEFGDVWGVRKLIVLR